MGAGMPRAPPFLRMLHKHEGGVSDNASTQLLLCLDLPCLIHPHAHQRRPKKHGP